ncbi:hypothetical protein CCHR01_11159 [Colletotrichum chrysophilum]|uniref:Uncharacterized protein n=1 Tax=Colletotrichum chrysophilum TaxID=1836956 RepID=A0AAD9ADN6_9PEZI|nr:hypothetical protein CCHR01_11159 [Colletotrichum chrysophilum]
MNLEWWASPPTSPHLTSPHHGPSPTWKSQQPPSRPPWTTTCAGHHTVPAAHAHPRLPLSFREPFHRITDQPHHLRVLQASRRPAKQATVFRPVFGRSSRRSCREVRSGT